MEGLIGMGDGEASFERSEIAVDSAEMVDDQREGTSWNLDWKPFESTPIRWTNEKHCLYLKSMEASFVNELHCSMGLLKRRAQKHALEKNPSEQFQYKTLRDGSWKNISVYGFGNKSEAALESRSLMENPWVRHFRRTEKYQAVEAKISQDIDENPDQEIESKEKVTVGSGSNLWQLASTLSREDSVGSNTEMSGQNFVDEGNFMKSVVSVRRGKRKKSKRSNADNDQVVPLKDSTISQSPIIDVK